MVKRKNTRRSYLRQRQRAFLDSLFYEGLDEQAALEKHRIGRGTYERWFGSELFREEFGRRIEKLAGQGRLIVARYSVFAAAKLVELTESEKDETARKACVDIIKLLGKRGGKEWPVGTGERAREHGLGLGLSETATGRLLGALAGEKSGTQAGPAERPRG